MRMAKNFENVANGDSLYSFDVKKHRIVEFKVVKIQRTRDDYKQVQIHLVNGDNQYYLWFPKGTDTHLGYSLCRENLIQQVRDKIAHAKAQIETLKIYIDQLNHLI